MRERVLVDMSKQSSAKDFVELIERISRRTASKSPVVRSKCNPNIVFVETHPMNYHIHAL